jgi:hypothetical protein
VQDFPVALAALRSLTVAVWLAAGRGGRLLSARVRTLLSDRIRTPTGAGYSLLLLAHVAAAVVGFGAICLTGLQGFRLRKGPAGPNAEGVRRYFRPGVNWPGRAIYLVPVLGFALLATSKGAFEVSDTFVVIGLVLWSAAAVVAELVVWPCERRIQRVLAEGWDPSTGLEHESRRLVVACSAVTVTFVAAVVVMVGQP